MLEIIWGLKTVAMMDVWTIEHLLSGISVGHAVKNNNHKVFKKKLGLEEHHIITRYFDVIEVLFLAYLWETIKHYLEIVIAGETVKYWFQGVEFWPNRIIFDPLIEAEKHFDHFAPMFKIVNEIDFTISLTK